MSETDTIFNTATWIEIQKCVAACWALDMYSDIAYCAAQHKGETGKEWTDWNEWKDEKKKNGWTDKKNDPTGKGNAKLEKAWTEVVSLTKKKSTSVPKTLKKSVQSKDFFGVACELRNFYWKHPDQITRYPMPAEINGTGSKLGFELKSARSDYSAKITQFHQASSVLIKSMVSREIFPQEWELALKNHYEKVSPSAYEHVAGAVSSAIAAAGGKKEFVPNLIKMTLLGRWDSPKYSLWSFYMFLEVYIRILRGIEGDFYSTDKLNNDPRFLATIEKELIK